MITEKQLLKLYKNKGSVTISFNDGHNRINEIIEFQDEMLRLSKKHNFEILALHFPDGTIKIMVQDVPDYRPKEGYIPNIPIYDRSTDK